MLYHLVSSGHLLIFCIMLSTNAEGKQSVIVIFFFFFFFFFMPKLMLPLSLYDFVPVTDTERTMKMRKTTLMKPVMRTIVMSMIVMCLTKC
jgi:hypothetical protein